VDGRNKSGHDVERFVPTSVVSRNPRGPAMTNPSRIEKAWFGLIVPCGFIFGLIAERRPFGDDLFAHPFVLYFVVVGVGLMLLRVIAARPVQELVPDRALVLGCLAGAGSFLAGNWVDTHLLRVY
jgi:hypothetical protein